MNAIKAKGNAAGQYLGYALQPVRLFYHLLNCPEDAYVGLEHHDDVSIHYSDGTTLVEQCKSATKGNPISDWSIDLWKTFHLWLENINAGVYDASTSQFNLYVTPIKFGKFAQQLSDLSHDKEIKTLLDQIKKERKLKKSSSKCAEYLDDIFNADVELICTIIRNFKLITIDSDPLSPIYNHLDATVSKETAEKACSYGIGDAMNRIEKSIKNGDKSLISAMEFRNSFRTFVRKYDPTSVLHSLSDKPEDEIVKSTLSSAPPFVRQLRLIDADIETTTRAASDYLRSSADRTKWAAQGIIFEDSIDEYNDKICARVQNLKTDIEITFEHLPPSRQGKLLYSRCCSSPDTPLQGRVTPLYYLGGALNDLANRTAIGWHPDYKNLLQKEE